MWLAAHGFPCSCVKEISLAGRSLHEIGQKHGPPTGEGSSQFSQPCFFPSSTSPVPFRTSTLPKPTETPARACCQLPGQPAFWASFFCLNTPLVSAVFQVATFYVSAKVKLLTQTQFTGHFSRTKDAPMCHHAQIHSGFVPFSPNTMKGEVGSCKASKRGLFPWSEAIQP